MSCSIHVRFMIFIALQRASLTNFARAIVWMASITLPRLFPRYSWQAMLMGPHERKQSNPAYACLLCLACWGDAPNPFYTHNSCAATHPVDAEKTSVTIVVCHLFALHVVAYPAPAADQHWL